MKSGTRKITAGNMFRSSTEKNRNRRPGKLKRENAYAAGTATSTAKIVVRVDTKTLFQKKRRKSCPTLFWGSSSFW